MSVGTIRVLVVEDSPTVSNRLREALAEDPDLHVAGVAEDGATAIELCRRIRPHVITMDMVLPVMSGLAATEYIMAHCPTPILVVSSSVNRAELFSTYDALAAGAVEVLEKPSGDVSDSTWERRLRSTVKLVARIPVITHPRGRLSRPPPSGEPGRRPAADRRCQVVAIGASAGGPGAVVELLRALPAAYPVPVLLVQHISAPFAASFVGWLGRQTGRRTSCAVDGEPVTAAVGRVVVAPAERHLVVRSGQLRLTGEAERHSCRPSVDHLFESVAREYGSAAAACLLTGMGRDGAAGLLALRKAGGLTFAQDEATSVVYGMPREAVELGAAAEVLAPAEIGRRLAALHPAPVPTHPPASRP